MVTVSSIHATWPSVLEAFRKTQTQWEGYLSYMYTDEIGLVTTGMGNLIDPIGTAVMLPWVHKVDNKPATVAEISAEWHAVKNAHIKNHYDAPTDRAITQLQLLTQDIDKLIDKQLLANESHLLSYFPEFDKFPADAQMAIHGMAWAMGSGFPRVFKGFTKAANQQSWTMAKLQSAFRLEAPQRKAGHDKMFDNAAVVTSSHEDPSRLYYPALALGVG